MQKLVILIEKLEDEARFEQGWPEFLKWAEQMPGIRREVTSRVHQGLFGSYPCTMIHELFFDNKEDLQLALRSPQGTRAGQVLQRITGGKITLLIAEHLEDEVVNFQTPQNRPRNTKDLQEYMENNEISGVITELKAPTPTVLAAAEAVGVAPEQIIKSVLFLVQGVGPVLAIACGEGRIDRRRIADHFEVGKKRVKLADSKAVVHHTGYPAGSVPPFGHPEPLTTLMDPKVLEQEFVYGGGGDGSSLVHLLPADILRATRAEVLPLLEDV